MKTQFAKARVIPVLVFSCAARDALSALVRALPDATIDIGTVLKANQIQRAADLGAKFAVSPGFDPALTETTAKADLFYRRAWRTRWRLWPHV